jgi:hypothetical protein
LQPFKPFYNDWLNVSALFDNSNYQKDYDVPLYMDCNIDFFDNLKFTNKALKKYRIDAVNKCAEILGDNIALTLSGGVDSQCMVQAFAESDVKFDVYTLVFNHDLNLQDVSSARHFCKVNKIKLHEIPIDIVRFLSFENYEYGIKYQSASPHFNTHYKLYNMLLEMGYSGVCSGGYPVVRNNNIYGINFRKNELNFINYTNVSKFPCIGNFLSFTPELSWAICLLTEDRYLEDDSKKISYINHIQQKIDNDKTYQLKNNGYKRSGFKIIPQEEKYTGFERVKKYFENITNDPLEFEKRFRYPLEKIIKPSNRSRFVISDEIYNKLNSIYNKNIVPSVNASAGVTN